MVTLTRLPLVSHLVQKPASKTKNQRATSKRKRKKKRKRERKERTPKEYIRDPPELKKVLPSLAEIKAVTRPSKHADLPVDVLLPTVKDCELLPCCSELKKPYIYVILMTSVMCSFLMRVKGKRKLKLHC